MRQFMGERIAAIRTDQDEIGKEIIKEFKRLYDIRCNLVHGRNSKKNYVNNLIVSRVYARQTTLWFISFLYEIVCKYDLDFSIKRQHILHAIDTGTTEIEELNTLISSMSDTFPFQNDWIL